MPLRHTLLGLLQTSPLHGYRLRKHARMFSWIYPMTNTSIYPTLHGLEKEAFVTHRSEIHNGRARKVYELTEAGARELSRWLTEPAPQDSSFRDQLLLKIAMLDDSAMAGGAREWLEAALVALRTQVEASESSLAQSAESDGRYARCAKEYGLEVLQLRIRMLEGVLATDSASAEARESASEHGSLSIVRRG